MRLRKLAAAVAPLPALLSLSLIGTADAAVNPLVALGDNAAPSVAHSARTSDVAASKTITAALSLKLHNETALDKYLADVQNPKSAVYRHFLKPAQFNALYGPTTADVNKALAYLKANGLTNFKIAGNKQSISFSGTETQLAKAFHTSFGNYADKYTGHKYYANDSAPELPASVSGVVANVVGLDNAAVRKHSATPAATAKVIKSQTPTTLKTAYGYSSLSATGSGVNVGFVEFDGYDSSNISTYDSQYGLSTGSVTTEAVDSASYDSSPGSGQIEVELDIEVVHAVAPAANDYVYEAPNSSAGELDMYNQIASDDTVGVVSISWGECESAEGSSQANSVNTAIKTGVAEGISYFAAAGDNGTTDCYQQTSSTAKSVDFPASSPYMMAVGGTKLAVTSANAWSAETVWNTSSTGGATGGGTSSLFSAPSWQSTQTTGKRELPDVSADADPASGYYIYSAGTWETVGGTSGATPLWAGFIALQNEIDGTTLGDLHSEIYTIGNGSSYTTGFHDVTSGNNSQNGTTGYSAATGYDEASGWGSFKAVGLSGLLG
jgi:kumamolisin